METTIRLKEGFSTLDQIVNHVKFNSAFEASKVYDHWEIRTDANGQMEHCVVIKKSGIHGAKAFFISRNILKLDYIIPNKVLNAYFGKSQKKHKNILEIIAEKFKNIFLAKSQKKAFNEITNSLSDITEV